MSIDDVFVITGAAGGIGLACAETLVPGPDSGISGCDIRVDGGLIAVGRQVVAPG